MNLLQKRLGFQLNEMQKKCIPALLSNQNVLVCAPTSSGKSALFQIAMINKTKQQKFVYLAPVKSLVQQKARQWTIKFPQLSINQMTSDSQLNSVDFDLILATPQKWKARGDKRIMLLDQLQLVNVQGRGDSLEVVVTRNIINSFKIIAVSATVPNIQDVAQWLRISPKSLLTFGAEHRPVPLQKYVLGYKGSTNPFIFQKTLNYKLLQVIRKYSFQGQSIIFCQTQKGTINALQQLLTDSIPRQFINQQNFSKIIENIQKIKNKDLARMIQSGLAFHHAGLDQQDRKIVQKLYSQKCLKVLCATSTLSQGVNLPARLVVIKSTICYRGSAQGYQEYSNIEVQQMMGRAGRTGLDKKGIVVIMTYKDNVKRYQNINRLQTLQSHLKGKLHQTINTQVSLRHITKISQCHSFLQSTFLAIRMTKVPQLYGKQINKDTKQYLKQCVIKTLKDLSQHHLLRLQSQKIYPQELGNILSKKYLSYTTLQLGCNNLQKISSIKECLQLVSRSSEFQKFRSKLQERKILTSINSQNQIKIEGAISSSYKKVFTLMISNWKQTKYQNWQLKKQSEQIIIISHRILSLWMKICYNKSYAKSFYFLFRIDKFNSAKCCDFAKNNQSVFIQIPDLNKKAASALVSLGFSLSDISKQLPNRLQAMAIQQPPFGNKIKQFLKRYEIPKIKFIIKTIEIELQIHRQIDQVATTILIFKKCQLPTIVKLMQQQSQLILKFQKLQFPVKIIFLYQGLVGMDVGLQYQSPSQFKIISHLELQSQSKNIQKKKTKSLQPSQIRKSIRKRSLPSIVSQESEQNQSKLKQQISFKTFVNQNSKYKKQQRRSQKIDIKYDCIKQSQKKKGKSTWIEQKIIKPQIKKDDFYNHFVGQQTIVTRFRQSQDHYLKMLQQNILQEQSQKKQQQKKDFKFMKRNTKHDDNFKFMESKKHMKKQQKQNKLNQQLMKSYYDFLTQ